MFWNKILLGEYENATSQNNNRKITFSKKNNSEAQKNENWYTWERGHRNFIS